MTVGRWRTKKPLLFKIVKLGSIVHKAGITEVELQFLVERRELEKKMDAEIQRSKEKDASK